MTTPKSQGFYTFEDGFRCWYYGLSAQEKKVEIRKHGKIISFIHTN